LRKNIVLLVVDVYADLLWEKNIIGMWLSGFSIAGSKFVSIVRRARMVSTGDNGIRLVQASEE
jgi:hypothetical protein